MKDNLVLDVSELRKKWAAEDLANALEKLKDDFERIEDLTIAEDITNLFLSLQTYLRVQHEPAPLPIKEEQSE